MPKKSDKISERPHDKVRPRLRWFHPTPSRLLVALLAVEGILLLSGRWFPKGYAVLIAIASVGVFLFLMLVWFVLTLNFHWRFQFSLRSLLVLTVAVAIPCSWLAVELKWASEQREVVEAIQELSMRGGWVRYDYEDSPNQTPSGPPWLRRLIGDDFFVNVSEVSLDETSITDAGLEHLNLKALAGLHYLSLYATQVTDAGLEHIKALTELQFLYFHDTHVTDAGLEHLKGLTQLKELMLIYTPVTNAGLEHL